VGVKIAYYADFRFPGGSSRLLARELRLARSLGHEIVVAPVVTNRFARDTPWHRDLVAAARDVSAHLPLSGERVGVDVAIVRHPADTLPKILSGSLIEAKTAHVVVNQVWRDGTGAAAPRDHVGSLAERLGTLPTCWPISDETAEHLALEGMGTAPGRWWAAAPTDHTGLVARRTGRTVIVTSARLATGDGWEPVLGLSKAQDVVVLVPREGHERECARLAEWAAQTGARIADLPQLGATRSAEDGDERQDADLGVLVDSLTTVVGGVSGPSFASAMYATLLDSTCDLGAVRALVARPGGAPGRAGDETGATAPRRRATDVPSANTLDDDGTRRPRALFITSNGAGMGHLTRELGIARALGDRVTPLFFSMSQGVPVVSQFGIPYEYVPFNSALRTTPLAWNDYFEARLTDAIQTFAPGVVVFDGVWPYAGLLRALRSSDVLRVWVRRGMWKRSISSDQLQRAPEFDLVIEPGDYAAAYDTGATTRVDDALRVAPITVLNDHELLSRADARAELGLSGDGNHVLITLGAGNINDITGVQDEFVRAVRGLGREWQVVVTRAAISDQTQPGTSSVKEVSVFPLARYARAFDFAVSAAGYNSFHEWINAALPTIWVPNLSTLTDDQSARSRFAADRGVGIDLAAPDAEGVRSAVERMARGDSRERMRCRASGLVVDNGAQDAADAIVALLTRATT
jgi:UDP:flavonoid glycosyltransferase YjiC (YdhE family)